MKTAPLLVCLSAAALASGLRADPAADRRLEDSLKSSYNFRSLFADGVLVRAADGVVTLTGTVSDDAQKALAADTAAALAGVARVDNQLAVAAPPERSDEAIAARVRATLLLRPDVSVARTRVAVHDGVVTLTGTADSFVQRALAAAFAKGVDGVRDVKNEIVAHESAPRDAPPGEAMDDASVAALVKFALGTHQSTKALDVRVAAKDGAVVIHGDASSDLLKNFVTSVAAEVRGVKTVRNDLGPRDASTG